MSTLACVEIKAFLPAKDFEVSKRFYAALGFECRSDVGGVAYFCTGHCAFLLQDFYQEAWAENSAMHLLVDDVQAWLAHVELADVARSFCESGVKVTPLVVQAWGLTEFVLIDPAGVCWHIGQNTPGFDAVGKVDPLELPSNLP